MKKSASIRQSAVKQSARLGAFFLLQLLLPAQLTHASIVVTGTNYPGGPGDWGSSTTV